MTRLMQRFTALLLVAALSLTVAGAASAAHFEFTITAKTAFDKMVGAADKATATALNKQYADIQSLQKQDVSRDLEISALHYKNKENEAAIRKRLGDMDQRKISSLDQAATKARNGYKPLFQLYDTQKKQLSLAKSANNKTMTNIVNNQIKLTKAAVDIANKDIRAKEAALKKAKADANAKKKEIRDMLSANKTTNIKIKSAKSVITSTKKLFVTESKVANQAARAGDSSATANSLARLNLYQRQILVQKANVLGYEKTIESVIAKASTKLNSYL